MQPSRWATQLRLGCSGVSRNIHPNAAQQRRRQLPQCQWKRQLQCIVPQVQLQFLQRGVAPQQMGQVADYRAGAQAGLYQTEAQAS